MRLGHIELHLCLFGQSGVKFCSAYTVTYMALVQVVDHLANQPK